MTIAVALLYALASGTLQTAPQTAPGPVPQTPVPQARTPPALPAQDQQDDQPAGGSTAADDNADVVDDVVVDGARLRGAVQGDIEPDITLTADQLQAYGATNVAELLAALEPLTRSSRGRGNGGPVVLLNGRRTSGFQEIRNIPFESIERTEILPEEASLTYGFPADQRLVNIVLKATFRQATAQGTVAGPSQGGRTSTTGSTGMFSILAGDRWNVNLERQHDTALFEDERDITRSPGNQPFDLIGNVTGLTPGAQIDPGLSALAGRAVTVAANPGVPNPTLAQFAAGANAPRTGDLGDYRTLLPRGDRTTLTASFARDLNETTKGTVSLNLDDSSSFSYLGLPGVTLTAPAGRNGSPFSRDVSVYRYISDPGAVTRDVETTTANLGLLLDGFIRDWRWTLTGAYDRVETDTETGRGLSATAAQAAVTAGTLNPFGALTVSAFTRLTDSANSVASGGKLEALFSGDVWEAPAGGLNTTFTIGVDTRDLSSESTRSGVFSGRSIGRDRYYGTANATLPLSNLGENALGNLSININGGYDEHSDVGGLVTWGGGFNWTPIDPIGFVVSYTDQEGAPTIQQLNDPVVVTPNAAVFDFRTGQTVLVSRTDGGNANLTPDSRHVWKAGVNFKPWSEQDFSLSSNYTRTEIDGAITGFPTITPDLEAALPGRFTRDPSGQLVAIDARAFNFTRTERAELRTGFNWSRSFGRANPAAGPGAPGGAPFRFGGPPPGVGGGSPGAGAGAGAGGPPPGGGGQFRFGGGGGGFGGRGGAFSLQPGQGRFNLSIYHTVRFTDTVTIRPGLPVLDLLDGDATSGRGGTPRNEIQVQGGVFRSGFGAFMNANWREATRVDGGVGGSDLRFSGQTTVALNVFADLTQRTTWVARFPILKGMRVNLGVQNLFDTRTEVTSSSGPVALNYQPDYLDPQGRVISLTLRKVLF